MTFITDFESTRGMYSGAFILKLRDTVLAFDHALTSEGTQQTVFIQLQLKHDNKWWRMGPHAQPALSENCSLLSLLLIFCEILA